MWRFLTLSDDLYSPTISDDSEFLICYRPVNSTVAYCPCLGVHQLRLPGATLKRKEINFAATSTVKDRAISLIKRADLYIKAKIN